MFVKRVKQTHAAPFKELFERTVVRATKVSALFVRGKALAEKIHVHLVCGHDFTLKMHV